MSITYQVTVNNHVTRWSLNGKLHRIDGPAIVYANGHHGWYLNGKLHREDGPAIKYADGSKIWYLNGELHREDGPAVEYADGDKHWYLNGQYHREDGPAVVYANGNKSWYLNHEELTESEFNARMNPAKEMTLAEIEKLLDYPVDLKGFAFKALPERLEQQAEAVRQDGFFNAARLMQNAADVLLYLQQEEIIILDCAQI